MNADIRQQVSKQHSFNALALSYVASHAASMSDEQLQQRLEHLGNHLLAFFGAHDLRDISPVKLEKFTYYLEAQGLESLEIQACLVSFRLCVRHAMHKQWDINPALLEPLVSDDSQPPERTQLSQQEYAHLYQDLLQDMTGNLFH
jgi:Phage integrase SAM-like domain